eukprot:1160650-Pelagomonas_calceolata.AAC.15
MPNASSPSGSVWLKNTKTGAPDQLNAHKNHREIGAHTQCPRNRAPPTYLHKELVLLRIPATDDQVVLAARTDSKEPHELYKTEAWAQAQCNSSTSCSILKLARSANSVMHFLPLHYTPSKDRIEGQCTGKKDISDLMYTRSDTHMHALHLLLLTHILHEQWSAQPATSSF